MGLTQVNTSSHLGQSYQVGRNIYNLFRKIFKFCEDKSNNVFREILKCFRKTAKFELSARNKLYIWNLQITRFKMIYDISVF